MKTLTICILSTLFASSLLADSVEDRLKAMESRIDALSLENQALRQQLGVAPAKAAPAVTAMGKVKSLALGGYIQLQAEAGDAPDSRFTENDRFFVRRARLGVKGSFAEDIDFVLQAELGSGTIGASTGYRAQIADAFAVWKKYDLANITFGQFKTPYGYDQLLSDSKTILIERPLPADKLTLSRQIGAMVSGKVVDGRLNYALGLFNGSGTNNTVNDNDNFYTVGRVAGTVVKNDKVAVTAGVGAFAGRDDANGGFTGDRDGVAADVQVAAGRFEAAAEWLHIGYNPDTGSDYTADGWSLLAAWTLIPKKVQVAARYETYDPNTDVAANDTDLWTVGCTYFLKGDDLKFSVNYLLGDSAASDSNQGRFLARLHLVY